MLKVKATWIYHNSPPGLRPSLTGCRIDLKLVLIGKKTHPWLLANNSLHRGVPVRFPGLP